jgi:lipopolysaccharide export system protein LptC
MLPSRSGARILRGPHLSLLLLLVSSCVIFAGSKHRKATPTPNPSETPEQLGLKNIPLTVGHEAKGLVLPNYDLQGHLLGRFAAATASRLDENHVHFTDLKMQTYDEKEQPEMKVDMSDAILNLDTKVIESKYRTKLKRADLEIAGNTMSFNTTTHQGTMTGQVHMTIFNQKEIAGATPKK